MNTLVYPAPDEKLLTIEQYQNAFKNRHQEPFLEIIARMLARFPHFSSLSEDPEKSLKIRKEIALCCELECNVEAGVTLLKQNTLSPTAYFILSGLTERCKKEGGEVIETIEFPGAGASVGSQSLLTGEKQLYDLVTRTECHLIAIHKSNFQKVAYANPEIIVNLLKVTQQVYFREVHIHDASRRLNKEERVMHFFRNIVANTDNKILADGANSLNVIYPFLTWLTQADIARRLDVVESTVGKVLNRLRTGLTVGTQSYIMIRKEEGMQKGGRIILLEPCLTVLPEFIEKEYAKARTNTRRINRV